MGHNLDSLEVVRFEINLNMSMMIRQLKIDSSLPSDLENKCWVEVVHNKLSQKRKESLRYLKRRQLIQTQSLLPTSKNCNHYQEEAAEIKLANRVYIPSTSLNSVLFRHILLREKGKSRKIGFSKRLYKLVLWIKQSTRTRNVLSMNHSSGLRISLLNKVHHSKMTFQNAWRIKTRSYPKAQRRHLRKKHHKWRMLVVRLQQN